MCLIESTNEAAVHLLAGCGYQDVVGQNVADDIDIVSHEHDPGPHNHGNDHHGQRTSLGDATLSVVCRANSSCDAVVELEVFKEVSIWVEDSLGHASVGRDPIYDTASQLVEEFRDISHASTELSIVELVVLEPGKGEVPGVGGTILRHTSIHLLRLPLVDPGCHVS